MQRFPESPGAFAGSGIRQGCNARGSGPVWGQAAENIARGAATKPDWTGRARHVAYAAGWKRFEAVWDILIRARQVAHALPVLEGVLSGLGRIQGQPAGMPGGTGQAARSETPAGLAAPAPPVRSSSG